jgi:hypothetical protein
VQSVGQELIQPWIHADERSWVSTTCGSGWLNDPNEQFRFYGSTTRYRRWF